MPNPRVTFAPAKINLYLHITGRREDGYHYLDSLVAFVGVGDRLSLVEADSFGLTIDGPMAGALTSAAMSNNLVTRAATLLGEALGRKPAFHMTLTKNLPVASGIGGGSTDAAAALRLMAGHWGLAATGPLLAQIAGRLGQDVPCCLAAETCLFRDIGNVTDPGPVLPQTAILLVNPGKGLSTPAVYKARTGAFQPEARLTEQPRDTQDLVAQLSKRTNGLTEAACSLLPEITQVLSEIAATDQVLLSRMSGSGATCFGLYPDTPSAQKAAAQLAKAHPAWWVVPTSFPYEKAEDAGNVTES